MSDTKTKHEISELRDHLFGTLEALRDKENPMDLARAEAVAKVGQVIVNSAKVEVDYMRITGNNTGSGFIPEEKPALPAPNGSTQTEREPPVRVHRLR